MKAVKLLRRDFDFPPVEVRLRKHAPAGAGLGGARPTPPSRSGCSTTCSPSASATPRWPHTPQAGLRLPVLHLQPPHDRRGQGEILSDYALDLEGWRIEVRISEGVHVSTRDAYSRVVPRECEPGGRMPLREALALPVERWQDALVNDFEPSVFALWPQVEAEKRRFYEEGAVYASMSGSGSSVFGIFRK